MASTGKALGDQQIHFESEPTPRPTPKFPSASGSPSSSSGRNVIERGRLTTLSGSTDEEHIVERDQRCDVPSDGNVHNIGTSY